jgi:hypothetical protein
MPNWLLLPTYLFLTATYSVLPNDGKEKISHRLSVEPWEWKAAGHPGVRPSPSDPSRIWKDTDEAELANYEMIQHDSAIKAVTPAFHCRAKLGLAQQHQEQKKDGAVTIELENLTDGLNKLRLTTIDIKLGSRSFQMKLVRAAAHRQGPLSQAETKLAEKNAPRHVRALEAGS